MMCSRTTGAHDAPMLRSIRCENRVKNCGTQEPRQPQSFKTQEPVWQTPISKSQVSHSNSSSGGGIQLSKKNALLNDSLTTTTTVEVFRAPLDPETPMISLTPSPFGGAPLLVRAHGPSYEHWNGQSRQNLLADELVGRDGGREAPKGVQWKERLIEESDRRYRDGSEYDEIAPIPEYPAPYIHNDYRPKPSFQPVTHPMIMSNSREDVRSTASQPPPYPAPLSPLYIVPDRHRADRNSVSPGQFSRRSNGYREERDNEHNIHRERYHRRSKSSTRDDPSSASVRSLRHRSMSPASRRSVNTFGGSQEFVLPAHSPIGSTLMLASPDPNELPGRPASARSQEIFALYQTRDAHNRIVEQL
uniref:Uncharacterized protein n=1 Tax=Caenorhabditis japonica TaxID=281687 RepID=A0A8R1HYL1_CAEJA